MNETFTENELLAHHRLNYHHLQYFWAVAREGHLTRAAQRLHVSQSALSSQIRQLESQLGTALFERSRRSLVLTEAGRLVYAYAGSIFQLGAELWARVQGGGGQPLEAVHIGHEPTLSRNFLENWLRRVQGRDSLSLSLQAAPLADLLQRLQQHRLDVVLANRLPAEREGARWQVHRLARQPVSIVAPAALADAAFRFPADLRARALVLPGPGSDIRLRFDALCPQRELGYRIAAEVDDMALLRLLARDSGCLAVLPPVVVQDELRSGALRELHRLRGIEETFYAITTERMFAPAALQELLRQPMRRVLAP